MRKSKQSSLQVKYFKILTILVGIILVFHSGLEMRFAFIENENRSGQVQLSLAKSAATRIESFFESITTQIKSVESLPWDAGYLTTDDHRQEFHRLLKIVPAIIEITQYDKNGREYLHVSRRSADRVKSGLGTAIEHVSAINTEAGASYSTIYYRANTAPHVFIAFTSSTNNGMLLVVEINLKFLADVVKDIKIDLKGNAFVVDGSGIVIAHPDLNIVLNRTQVSSYTKLQTINKSHGLPSTTKPASQPSTSSAVFFWAKGMDGGPVLTSATPISSTNWLMLVEQPKGEVLKPVYATLYRAVGFLGFGLVAAFVVSYLLARVLVKPILKLGIGAKQIAGGNLSARISIDTNDEVEQLSVQFNSMAAQLQDYTQNLEQKVADKTLQLELANKHKSEFLANMSHELRTPLNAVIGFSDALREEYFGSLNDKQREYVNDIALSGQHLLSLINDILDLSKIESGMMDLSRTHFSVDAAIDNAMVLIRERAIRQEVTVTSEIGEGVDLLYADERKFKQVLINLLTNAVKFTYPNGWVKIRSVIEGKDLLVSVADSGMGIAAEDFETVFQEFRQLTTVGEATHEGTGLGLPLAKRIVELHGGRIWLESELGKGATFWFVVPLGTSDDVDLMKVQ